uniref:Uncharacterized protein n=1 Tax=viral metagenome TaxID=1070528 RepID=A0A6C0EG72_9ZZZZ
METTNTKSIFLMLGDIIQIISPTNETFHEKRYFVDYIDKHYIKVMNNSQEEILTLNASSKLNDTSITKIRLLKRKDNKGYAKQNHLNQGTWVNIHFTGDFPTIVTGYIQSLEEDMIEVKLADDSYIYIDFAYKGIPIDFNISKIEIRDPPKDSEKIVLPVNDVAEQTQDNSIEEIEETKSIDSTPEEIEETKSIGSTPEEIESTPNEFQEEIIQKDSALNQLEEGSDDEDDDLGEIAQFVKVDEDKLRYGIHIQLDDLTNALIGKENGKNKESNKKIEKIISRYSELRDIFSKKDHNDYPYAPLFNGIENKPLANVLEKMENNMPWIIPIMSEKHKLYDIHFDEEQITDAQNISYDDERNFEKEQLNNYKTYGNKTYYDKYLSTFSPYLPNDELENMQITKAFDAISHNNEQKSSHIHLDEIKDVKNVLNRILPGDEGIHLHGFICLFTFWLNASKAYLPYTNLLKKATFIIDSFTDYSKVYKNSRLKSKELTNEATNYDFKFEDMVYVHHNPKETSLTWKEFLHKVLPSNRNIIENYNNTIMKAGEPIGLQYMVSHFHPFYMEINNIVFEDSDILTSKIYEKRRNFYKKYNANVKQNKGMFDSLKRVAGKNYYGKNVARQGILENYFQGKTNEEKEIVISFIHDSYFSNSTIQFNTPHERLLYYTTQDSLDCFSSILSYASIHLLNPDIEELLLKYQEQNDSNNSQTNAKDISTSICKTPFVVAKKYIDSEELKEDDDKVIYFDKQFDKTYYTAVEIYSQEKKRMSQQQFISFLEKKMMEVHQLSEDESKTMVSNILLGKKKVENGHYCILETKDNMDGVGMIFYKRVNNTWKENKEANEMYQDNYSLSLNNSICFNNFSCFDPTDYQDVCEDSNDRKKQLQLQLIQEMMNEYKHVHARTKSEYKEIVMECEFYLKRLRNVYEKRRYHYSVKNNQIASEYDEMDGNLISPHVGLRDEIRGIKDFEKKQDKIFSFIKNYCRQPFQAIGEDPYWLYCKETQLPLLPLFIHTLNLAYHGKENYIYAMEIICQKQGALSDDEGSWVDIHSGYTIRNIDFFADEGFTDKGFKDKTREILETDKEESIEKYEAKEEALIQNDYEYEYKDGTEKSDVVDNTTTSEALEEEAFVSDSINITNEGEIQEIVSSYTNSDIQFIDTLFYIMETKLDLRSNNDLKHKLLVKLSQFYDKFKAKGQESSYKLVLLFLSSFVVYLEMRVSEISFLEKQKTCKPYLLGFPVHSSDNMDTIKYVVCLAKKYELHRSLVKPSTENIINEVTGILTIISSNEFASLIKNYLLSEKVSKEKFIDQYQWREFVPPLFKYHIKRIQPLQKDSVINNEYKNIILSKIILYSYSLLETIQNITSKQSHLLVTSDQVPYLENACCLRTKNPMEFFIEENKEVQHILDYLTNLYEIFDNLRHHQHVPMFSFTENTKILFPNVDPGFSDVILEKIKATIRIYNNDDEAIDTNIMTMLLHVYRNNKIRVNHVKLIELYSPVIDYLTYLKEKHSLTNKHSETRQGSDASHSNQLLNQYAKFNHLYGNLIVNYNDNDYNKVQSNDILEFKSFLFEDMEKKYKNIANWLNVKKSRSAKKQPVVDILEFIYSCHETTRSYDYMVRFTQMVKSFVYMFSTLIPNMIINKLTMNKIKIPKHWELSPSHIMDLQNYMKTYYTKFTRFIDNDELNTHFRDFMAHTKDYYGLFSQIKMLPMQDNISTNILMYSTILFTIMNEFITLDNQVGKPILMNYVINVLETFYQQKSTTFIEYESVMKQILRSKQDEKDKIVKKLKEKTKEERAVINELKKYKLGEWGKGLQKGLVEYDVNVFEQERNLFLEDEMREINDLSGYDEDYNHEDHE